MRYPSGSRDFIAFYNLFPVEGIFILDLGLHFFHVSLIKIYNYYYFIVVKVDEFFSLHITVI